MGEPITTKVFCSFENKQAKVNKKMWKKEDFFMPTFLQEMANEWEGSWVLIG